jgi:hypothetical protein
MSRRNLSNLSGKIFVGWYSYGIAEGNYTLLFSTFTINAGVVAGLAIDDNNLYYKTGLIVLSGSASLSDNSGLFNFNFFNGTFNATNCPSVIDYTGFYITGKGYAPAPGKGNFTYAMWTVTSSTYNWANTL